MSSKPDIKPAIAPNPAAPAEAPPPPPHDAMRRLQIGIAGVLTVLLLVGMAGLIGDRARERAGEDGRDHAESGVVAAAFGKCAAPKRKPADRRVLLEAWGLSCARSRCAWLAASGRRP